MRKTLLNALTITLCGLMTTACGGGGGDAAVPPAAQRTTINGTTSPPAAPDSAIPNLAGPTNMLIPPIAGSIAFAAIVQQMDFTLDISNAAAVRIASATTYAVHHDGVLTIGYGAAYAGDATLGQWLSFDPGSPPSVPTSLASQPRSVVFDSIDSTGPMPSAVYASGAGLTLYNVEYVLPVSATLNPSGYTYQTFGEVNSVDTTAGGAWGTGRPASEWTYVDAWFSTGIPTPAAAIPVAGSAAYVGVVSGTSVTAGTRDAATMNATVNAMVNFTTRTVALTTTASTSLSANSAIGTPPSANAGLNLSGTLSYSALNNTFTGPVTSTSGLAGNATCRFYGPGIGAATGVKVLGSPTEIGCTFAANNTTTGVMQGALGAN